MRNLTLGSNMAVLLLFFGVALFEAIRSRSWLGAALFLALGLLCLWADVPRRFQRGRSPTQ